MLGWLKALLSPKPAGEAHLLRRFGGSHVGDVVEGTGEAGVDFE